MRRRMMASILAACFLVVFAPVANAGPGSGICTASQRAYETVTGKRAPWQCPY